MKNLLILLSYIFTTLSFSQAVVINELDCDSPGLDNKEFVELLTITPNMSLDGYILVLFNGSNSGNDSSYFSLDLNGAVSDENGLLVISSTSLNPFPQLIISENVIQNGADAIAVYQDDISNFPEGTLATTNNLIDALVYDTSDTDDTNLLMLLGQTNQINEGSGNNTNSIQRFNDGSGNISYVASTPTPRALNDGSGIIFNAIEISTTQEFFNEEDTFNITFTAQNNVSADATFSFTLNNFGFNASDFTGNTTVTIPTGQNSISTSITIIDDTLNEGDEEPLVKFLNLQSPYIPYNNFLKLRAIDNDFVVAPYGTPTNPTFEIVQSTQPVNYYNNLDNKADIILKQALQDIVADETVVRAQTYNDVYTILKEADVNPENSNEVWLLYSEEGRPKLDQQTSSTNTNKWNREHTFPRSLGGFESIEQDDIADGINVFWTTKADSLRHAYSDAHALRATDAIENSVRNNQHYGEYNGPTGNLGSFKGDVARSVLFLEIRYNGLSIKNGFPDIDGQMGDLATLLDWHRNDPPDDFEMNRNNVIYQWQFNRNPFIDQPDLVEYIWGNQIGNTWNQPLSVTDFNYESIKIHPNPVTDKLFVSGNKQNYSVSIYSSEGRKISTQTITNNTTLDLNLASGLYLVNFEANGKSVKKKILVE